MKPGVRKNPGSCRFAAEHYNWGVSSAANLFLKIEAGDRQGNWSLLVTPYKAFVFQSDSLYNLDHEVMPSTAAAKLSLTGGQAFRQNRGVFDSSDVDETRAQQLKLF